MMHRYETAYGIHNHDLNDDVSNPLALIAMHRAEDNFTNGPLYEKIKQFHECDIFRTFGLSLKEFFDLPTYINSYLLEIASKKLRESVNTKETEIKKALNMMNEHPVD